MKKKPLIWIVDDDKSIRWVLDRALSQAGFDTATFESGIEIERKLTFQQPDAIISDIRMPDIDGLTLMEQIVRDWPDLPVIIITAHSDLESAVAAYQGGAFEYLPKPFDVDDAVDLVQRALDHKSQKTSTIQETQKQNQAEIIGEAPAMQEVFRAIGRLSKSNITVMINGESGTGKELVAQALHKHSPRAHKPFIAINTAAIPKDLLESELFGHEKGAFTGAQGLRRGRFEQADGGTLFLDEIGDMPSDLQTRLLRVLASGEFYRVGGLEPVKVDVRIIAATHQNLETLVEDGRFREDLFHRLNVIRIKIPSLRERREDIKPLIDHYLKSAAKELDVEPKKLRPETETYLKNLDWPGNVRQLENTCRWLTVMAPGPEIYLDDLPPELHKTKTTGDLSSDNWESVLKRWAVQQLQNGSVNLLDDATPRFEKVMIDCALLKTGGHRQEAARLLGWGRNTLTRKIKELNMEVENLPEEL